LNKKKKTISYYRNGEFIGVAFKKIKGKKFYAAVQTCHRGSDLIADFKPKKLPKSLRSDSDSDDSDDSKDDSDSSDSD
jgi:hypothetical protein